MTNFEKITKDKNALVRFLHENFTEGPWNDWFSETYCDRCSIENSRFVGHGLFEAPCESDCICPYFDVPPTLEEEIELWLDREVDKDDNK